MYHFCEMTRMIQAQSASLVYFMDIIGKVYSYVKEFILTRSKNCYDSTKIYLVEKLINLKKFFKEFFSIQNNKEECDDTENNKKIKNHIKILDNLIKYLLISAALGYTLKFIFGKHIN